MVIVEIMKKFSTQNRSTNRKKKKNHTGSETKKKHKNNRTRTCRSHVTGSHCVQQISGLIFKSEFLTEAHFKLII